MYVPSYEINRNIDKNDFCCITRKHTALEIGIKGAIDGWHAVKQSLFCIFSRQCEKAKNPPPHRSANVIIIMAAKK